LTHLSFPWTILLKTAGKGLLFLYFRSFIDENCESYMYAVTTAIYPINDEIYEQLCMYKYIKPNRM
jgi:hypothetical protein